MQTSLGEVKIATINGKAQSLQESHRKADINSFHCSDFLASMSLLAVGECSNRDDSRKAIVVITDLSTGELKGCFGLPFKKPFCRFWV